LYNHWRIINRIQYNYSFFRYRLSRSIRIIRSSVITSLIDTISSKDIILYSHLEDITLLKISSIRRICLHLLIANTSMFLISSCSIRSSFSNIHNIINHQSTVILVIMCYYHDSTHSSFTITLRSLIVHYHSSIILRLIFASLIVPLFVMTIILRLIFDHSSQLLMDGYDISFLDLLFQSILESSFPGFLSLRSISSFNMILSSFDASYSPLRSSYRHI